MLSQNHDPIADPLAPLTNQVNADTDNAGIAHSTTENNQRLDQTPTSFLLPPVVFENRNKDQIDLLLETRGFPEMNRSWQHFKKLGLDLANLKEADLFRERQLHSAPLGKYPKLLSASIISASAAIGFAYSSLLEMPNSFLALTVGAIATLNTAFITLIATTGIRRRLLSNMEDIMARELGLMLKKEDFRDYLKEHQRTLACNKNLESSGFNSSWDNSSWSIIYTREKTSLVGMPLDPCKIAITAIKSVLGSKDDQQRQFIPGKYFSSLYDGKKSIKEILSTHGELIKSINSGSASIEDCVDTLKAISANYLKESSAGKLQLEASINLIKGALGTAEWKAQVWSRNPIVDLTYQDEFYSSASLRGVKVVGRGIKGRLGTFLYLWNPAVTMLDISSSKGRVIRARILAVKARALDGNNHPAILVDGVEGTTAVPRDVIKCAIEDYARAIGVKTVLYNAFAYNIVPKRFAEFIKEQGSKLVGVDVAVLDQSERQYLDSFGLPLEPFDYAFAKGKICVLQSNLYKDSPEYPLASNAFLFMQTLRRNMLSIFAVQAIGFSAIVSFAESPIVSLGIVAFGAAGIIANLVFQRRSLKKTSVKEK